MKTKYQEEKKKNDNRTNKPKDASWYYQDHSGIIQGPFHSSQMIMWKEAGFFPLDTLVRLDEVGAEELFYPMHFSQLKPNQTDRSIQSLNFS